MQILAHRGLWKDKQNRNDITSFIEAFRNGYGIETDIRDNIGNFIISHNPYYTGWGEGRQQDFNYLYDLYTGYHNPEKPKLTIAFNIKSDGLYELPDFERYFKIIPNFDFFFFDMSVPEQVQYLKRGLPVYTRASDIEPNPVLLNESTGIWLDQFYDGDFIVNNLEKFLSFGKPVCVVSPELHGRENYLEVWDFFKKFSDYNNILICTDKPKELEEFIWGEKLKT